MGQDDELRRRVKEDPGSADRGCGDVFTPVCTRGDSELLIRISDAGIRVAPVLTECRGYLLENLGRGRLFWHDVCPGGKRGQAAEALARAAILLDAGASISGREDECGSTPLAWAARTNMPDMVEYLPASGAPTNLPDDEPWATPLAWAERRGHSEVAEILRKHGAAR